MKNINKIALLAFAAVSFASCQDFLDVTPDNRAQVDSEEKITALLVSAYPTNTGAMLTEFASDNAMDNGETYAVAHIQQEEAYMWEDMQTVDDDSPKSLWDACYRAIASANQALLAIEEMGDPASLSAQKAEALICRAFGHYQLANFFCMAYDPATAESTLGLPYSTTPETLVAPDYERGNLKELFENINADIEAALPEINDNLYSVPKYHFNKSAAYAFAARFNLLYHNLDKCIEYSNVVLGNNPQQLLKNYAGQSKLSVSDGFNAYVSAADPGNLYIQPVSSLAGRMLGWYGYGERYNHGSKVHKGEGLGAGGPWGSYFTLYMGRFAALNTKNCMLKITEFFEYTDKTNGIGYTHVVFVPFTTNKTLLCRAEAYALKGDYPSALADINVWMAANHKYGTELTQEKIIEFYDGKEYCEYASSLDDSTRTLKKHLNPVGFTIADDGIMENYIHTILQLHRLETLQEGERWENVKRYGIEVVHNRINKDPLVLTVNDPRRAFQLPQDVINAGLEANPR